MLKRLVVSALALGVLLTSYVVYVRLFGHLAGLDELDRRLLPKPTDTPWNTADPSANHAKDMARRIWGDNAWQAGDDVFALYWLQSGVVIYIKDYERTDAQDWRLIPFSLVYREHSRSDTRSQIVTLQGDEATLQFDRPVDLIRLSGARPIGGTITGNVQVHADRGTDDDRDDIGVYTDRLEFLESESRIWTESPVRIVASGAVLRGIGGEIHLEQVDTTKRSKASPYFQGVKDFVLFRDIQLDMLMAAGGGLGGGFAKSARRSDTSKQPPQSPVKITCQGPFSYDLPNCQTMFTNNVVLERQTGEAQFDRIFSDELEILFEDTRHSSDSESAARTGEQSLQFRQARARGQRMRILSDAQNVEAIGDEMLHDAASGETVLHGTPDVAAMQEENVLHGRELKFSRNERGEQIAEVVGVGNLESRDFEQGDTRFAASWREWARLEPQGQGGNQQLLVIHGEAKIRQPGRGTFTADRIKAWLEKHDSVPGSPASDGVEMGQWAPARIEGLGNVVATSDQFILEATRQLEMVFDDRPASEPNPQAQANRGTRGTKGSQAGSAVQRGAGSGGSPSKNPGPRAPSRLRADLVKIKATRDSTGKSDISEVWTEGNVDFQQPPDEQGKDTVTVRGDALRLKRIMQKNHLEVAGRPAHVDLDTLKLRGAHVGIDQPTNIAWVDGKGSMVLPSDSSFDGKKLASPSELTISWGQSMFFDGLVAEFSGGIEANQDSNQLRCQRLEAFLLDRLDISAPRKNDGGGAKINKLICTDAVVLDNVEYAGDKLVKSEHLESARMEFSNDTGRMIAEGPGMVRTYTRGSTGPLPTGQAVAPSKSMATPRESKNEDQLQLTEIHFAKGLEGLRAQQIAKFTGHTDLIRAPVKDEKQLIDPDSAPPNSMRLACEELEMATRKGPGDQSFSEMLGTGNVTVETDVYSGRGDRISYNELHERIIFESRTGSFATLYRQTRPGQRWDETRAFKIFYNLRTGDVKVEGAVMMDLHEREADLKNSSRIPTKKL